MSWKPLRRFRDPTVPKLDNLRRAARAGLRVPATVWAPAGEARTLATAPLPFPVPLIVRSGSPTEDTRETSNAGQFLSLRVAGVGAFAGAVERVVAALPADNAGSPRGVVFVQPLVQAVEAGVAFFDGFYFERTTARGDNEALTSGQARGDVARGHLHRADPWSAWLASVYRVFGGAGGARVIDVEFARDAASYVLLQARPALFAIARNETLSLANHKEILGDPPSPWIAAALVEAGRHVFAFWASFDRAVARWDESYAVPLAERAWMNFSFFFRLMDHWGLPRTMVVRGVGGESGGGPADERPLWGRMLRSAGSLVRLQIMSLLAVLRLERGLRTLDAEIERADGLPALFRATAAALAFAIRGNFAIASVLNAVRGVRGALGVRGAARVVTQEMIERWTALAGIATVAARDAAFDAWIAQYGHRGPLESDLARPRFAELRDVLRADLEARATAAAGAGRGESTHATTPRWRALFWMDERREWFRDQVMRRWQRLRARALAEGQRLVDAGALDAREDVFWLRGEELTLPEPALRAAVAGAKRRIEAVKRHDLPLTASRDAIERAMAGAETAAAAVEGRRVFSGISLGPATVEGRAVKADDLTALLVAEASAPGSMLGPDAILVVPALEPSWAIVFPRVLGVVAEIGGELSHASILLREAKRPAIVNCAGIVRHVRTGDRLRLDGGRGLVEILGPGVPTDRSR